MKRLALYAAIAILAIRLAWMFVIPGWSQITTDYQNYYTAAWAVRHGEPLMDLYDPFWFENEKTRAGIVAPPALFNYYTPFSALVMWPIAGFSPITAKHAWTLINVAALIGVIALVSRGTSSPVAQVVLIALLGGDALGNNFTFGQFYIVLALLMVLAIEFRNRIPWLSGISTGLAMVVKVFPGFLLAYFAVTRRWRALWWSLGAAVLLLLIGIIAMGWIPHRVFFEEVLPRMMRGEVQDPYNIHFNTLQALLRRALMPEPGLNPTPIIEAPTLYFFVRTALSLSIALITLLVLRKSAGIVPFLELGLVITAVSLMTPSQASYHHFLLFPGIVAAVQHTKDIRGKALLGGGFALISSNVMGATARWDSGLSMLLAFPRVYLIAALWIFFLAALGVKSIPRRTAAIGLGIVIIVSGISAANELARYEQDQRDGAKMTHPDSNSYIEMFPTVGEAGVTYSALRFGEYQLLHASAFDRGLVHEVHGAVFGRLADGYPIAWSGASEPSIGPISVAAIRRDDRGWSVVERTKTDTDWREVYLSSNVLHDPAIAPDNTRIAFSEWLDGHYRIVEWSRATHATRMIVSGESDYRYPAYTASNRWVFYSTNASGNWDVIRMWTADGRRETVAASAANDFMSAVSADEQTLYFASDRRRGYRFSAIYQVPLRQ